jgi:hypothetical protein
MLLNVKPDMTGIGRHLISRLEVSLYADILTYLPSFYGLLRNWLSEGRVESGQTKTAWL